MRGVSGVYKFAREIDLFLRLKIKIMNIKNMQITYIGNFIAETTKYITAADILSDSLRKEGYVVYKTSHKINKTNRLLDMLWVLFRNRKLTDVVLIDTFSTTNFYYALATSQWARILKLSYINILHGGNLPMRLQKNPYWCQLIFKNAKSLVAPSNYLKEAFENQGYQVQLIPNIIPIADYTFKERQQLQPKLLWVRAFDNIYNPEMAIEVLRIMINKYPKAELCMVGPVKDESFNNTQLLVRKYGLEKKVIFTGVLTKKEWHQLAEEFDIFINTTNIDNTPVSVMEAMALGLPVISTNVGGMSCLIEDNQDGILVNPKDTQAMVDAICRLIENPNIAMELVKQARKKVEQMDWSVVKNHWNKVLGDV